MLQGRTTKRVFKKVAQIWNVDLRWNDIQVAHGDTEGIVKDQKLLQRHHSVAETPHSGYSGSGSGGSMLIGVECEGRNRCLKAPTRNCHHLAGLEAMHPPT